MIRNILLFAAICLYAVSRLPAQSPKPSEAGAVRSILLAQQDAWNRGDLEGFMQGYWNSDSLLFIGSKGPAWGWNTTLQNYKRSYPDAETMDKLTFGNLMIRKLAKGTLLMVGSWHLARTKGDLSGYFSLTWKKMKGEWVIVADHSS